jgi:hypothetical protein
VEIIHLAVPVQYGPMMGNLPNNIVKVMGATTHGGRLAANGKAMFVNPEAHSDMIARFFLYQ